MAIRKGDHGTQNLFIYPIDEGAYLDGLEQLGLRGVTRESEQEITNFYADNTIHLQIKGTQSQSGEITLYQIEDEIYTSILGYKQQPNGALTDNGQSKNFGLAYAKLRTTADGDTLYVINVVFECTASAISKEDVTDEDAVELVEYIIPYTGKESSFVYDADGDRLSYMEFVMPEGTSEQDVIDLLSAGIPLPTDSFTTPATGTLGVIDDTVAQELSGTYTYTANDSLISESKISIFESTDLVTEVDSITPLTEGVGTAFTFSTLTDNTSYTIVLYQGTTELDTVTATTTTP